MAFGIQNLRRMRVEGIGTLLYLMIVYIIRSDAVPHGEKEVRNYTVTQI